MKKIKSTNEKYDTIEFYENSISENGQVYKNLTGSGQPRLQYLRWWDIFILTIILFGKAIYDSNIEFFQDAVNPNFIDEILAGIHPDYVAFSLQGILLIFALLYLLFRRFDFSKWKIKITPKAILVSVLLFIFVALLMDLHAYLFYHVEYAIGLEASGETINHCIIFHGYHDYILEGYQLTPPEPINFSTISYSLLNGFYEEIFFLGICLAVRPRHIRIAFLYSMVIRFSFHTYQGMMSAIGIMWTLGIVYFVLYTKSKDKNMIPYFLSHSIADIIGLSVIDNLILLNQFL